MKTELVE